jgi:hypothetical protein
MENLLDCQPEKAGHLDGQRERGIVPALLDRVDGLPGDAKGYAERLLRQ